MPDSNSTTRPRRQHYISRVNQTFGILTIIEYLRDPVPRFRCQCECGTQTSPRCSDVISGNTTSCGCLEIANRITHGMKHLPEYQVWLGMKARCSNPKQPKYHNYGGRGIIVCDRWENDFAAFMADMGSRPSPRHQIDRIDNNGPYSPDNCKWSTLEEQARNTRRTKMITFNGTTMCQLDWAVSLGINMATLRKRLSKWPLERALTEAVNQEYSRS